MLWVIKNPTKICWPLLDKKVNLYLKDIANYYNFRMLRDFLSFINDRIYHRMVKKVPEIFIKHLEEISKLFIF